MGKMHEVKSPTATLTPFTITGLLADLPTLSHLQFDMLGSLPSITEFKDSRETWIWTIFGTYGLVREGTDVAALTEKLQALPPKWAGRTTQAIFQSNFRRIYKGSAVDAFSSALARHLPGKVAFLQPVWSIREPGVRHDLRRCGRTRPPAVFY